MARYQLTAPDGSQWEVNAPDNASQDQVLAYAQQNWSQPAPQEAPAQQQLEGETTLGGVASEVGKGLIRGPSEVAGMMRSAPAFHPALAIPKAGAAIAEATGIPQKLRELVKPTPQSRGERFAGTAAELGSAAAVSGAGLIPALTTSVGGAVGEAALGEWGKVLGSVLGPAGLGALQKLVKAGGGVVRDISRATTEKGREKIVGKIVAGELGKENVAPVARQLETAPEYVPGARSTAAELTAGMPEASPLAARQQVIASSEAGPSAMFGKQKLAREAALKEAAKQAEATGKPVREAALDAATATNAGFALNGVRSEGVLRRLDTILQRPMPQQAQTVLNKIRRRIADHTDKSGRIDPRELYDIRQTMGQQIKGVFETSRIKPDKVKMAIMEREMQKRIDAAIRAGGAGPAWNRYLRDYAKAHKNIRAERARTEAMYEPPQRTDIGGRNLGAEATPQIPNPLSRSIMIANFILRGLGKSAEPALERTAANMFLDPKKLAKLLKNVKSQEDRALALYNLIERGYIPASAAGATAASAGQ